MAKVPYRTYKLGRVCQPNGDSVTPHMRHFKAFASVIPHASSEVVSRSRHLSALVSYLLT